MYWVAEFVYMIAPTLALISPALVNIIGCLFGKIMSAQGDSGMMIGFILTQILGILTTILPNLFSFLIVFVWNGESGFIATQTIWFIHHWVSNVTILASIACALIWMALAVQKPWFCVACIAYFVIIYFCHQSFVTYGVGAIKYIDPEYSIDDGML